MRARPVDRFKHVRDDTARHVLWVADQRFGEAFEKGEWKGCRAALEETPGLLEVLEPWKRLWYAVAEMSLPEVQDAVTRGLIEATATTGANTDLMCKAAGWGRLDVMRWLWSERQKWGYEMAGMPHALHEACSFGQLEATRWLLDLGVSASDAAEYRNRGEGFQFGELPLFAACYSGSREVIELLLERGVDPNAIDRRTGFPPVVMAAKHGRKAIEPLLRAGADLEARQKDDDGWDVGVLAMSFGDHIEVGNEHFEYLLSVGVDATKHGDALVCAASIGRDEVVRRLLDLGVDVNHRCFRDRESALMCASARGHRSTVELLLERGGDPNLTDKHGRTALVRAAADGPHVEVIDMLIAAGATPECVQGTRSFWQHIAKLSPQLKRDIRSKILTQTMQDAMQGSAVASTKPVSAGPGPL